VLSIKNLYLDIQDKKSKKSVICDIYHTFIIINENEKTNKREIK